MLQSYTTSYNRSPATKTYHKLPSNYMSPIERVTQFNKSHSKKKRLSLSKDSSQSKLKLKNSQGPFEIKQQKSYHSNFRKSEIIA